MPRRGENIHKRKDGRWEARYIKARINDKTIYKSIYASSYREVKTKLKEQIKYDICLSDKIEQPKKIKFDEVFNQWIKYKQNFIKESTYNKYLNLYENYIRSMLKEIYIDELSNNMIQEKIVVLMNLKNKQTKQKLSSSTIRSVVYLIKSTILFAQKKEYIKQFYLQIDMPTNEAKNIKVLSRSEQGILETYTKNKLDMVSLAVLICLYTGLRIGELCALKWENIDFLNKCIIVNKTVQRVQKKGKSYPLAKTALVVTSPKTKNAQRKIPIPSVLYSILKTYYGKEKIMNEHYVFVNKSGDMIDPRTVQYHFKRIIELTNIQTITFHALRHTFATRCIELGMDIKTLSEILGHSNVSTTMNIYVHSTEIQKFKQMELLSQL